MQMDFIVDKEAKTVTITKEFAAERDLVWDAYTKPELLDQWWAPKPSSPRKTGRARLCRPSRDAGKPGRAGHRAKR